MQSERSYYAHTDLNWTCHPLEYYLLRVDLQKRRRLYRLRCPRGQIPEVLEEILLVQGAPRVSNPSCLLLIFPMRCLIIQGYSEKKEK